MKTALTIDMEKALYAYWREQGASVVEEVTMPDDQGIVDTLVRQKTPAQVIWRCYELKVTKTDFHSHAKLSFIGHYNYFVLTEKLYQAVASEIPQGIGVLTYHPYAKAALAASTDPTFAPGELTIVKNAQYQDLKVSEEALTDHFIASLNREVAKAKQVERGLAAFSTQQLYDALRKRSQDYDLYHPEDNLLDRLNQDLETTALSALQAEVDSLNAELALKRLES